MRLIFSLFAVLVCFVIAAVVITTSGVDVGALLNGDATPAPPTSDRGSGGSVHIDGALLAALLGIGGSLAVCVIGAGALAAMRLRARRHRTSVRFELTPFRADEATPDQVRRLLEAWHQQLLEGWQGRPTRGQAAIALEVVMERGDQDRLQGRFLIAVPAELAAAAEGALRACYPNSRLDRREAPLPALSTIIRLKKRETFIQALNVPADDQPPITDGLLSEMLAQGSQAVAQIVLTPTPPTFEFYARRLFRGRERSATRRRSWDRAEPGMGSELLSRELEAGLAIQHRPLYFADIRIAAESQASCRAIGAVLRSASSGENRLIQRALTPGTRRMRIYQERLRRAVGNPLPSWRKGVYASTELAGLWRLPSPALTAVPIVRSSVPRVGAPPQISREPSGALLRDESGPVGIRPEDKSDGLSLIGGQKTGKTSALCQTVRVDAADPNCAVIVLMPKPGDALKALSTVPPWRTVHYLDFEAPEFGINPLMADGEAAMVADKVVDAFKDINMEGDIRGSSDRYLRQAAQAAIGASRAGAIEGPPNLWHMYRLLLPNEEAFREHVVEAIFSDPRYTDSATFFGRDLPSDLVEARVNTASKLDAPRNKILRLLVEALDKVLRHPRQLDLDDIVRNREVLIVDGKMGTFGADNCRVMLQFILNMLYGTLQRQQQLPEAERVRVAVKVDEAHLILNDSFADALATLRSAGLEVVAAWQYGEQIQDPKIRGGMMSLLRQRCMFSMGESADAREMSEIAMAVYTDMIRADPESRARLQFTPDTIFNLPNHHALCTWISKGARAPAFIAQTVPLREDASVVAHHLAAQRARGGYVPDRLPDPLPDVANDALRELPLAPMAVAAAVGSDGGEGGGTLVAAAPPPVEPVGPPAADSTPTPASASPPPPPPEHTPTPTPTPTSAPAPAPPARPPAALPDSYTELDLDDVRGLSWEAPSPQPPEERPEPTPRELEILGALWRYRVLFSSQIHRRWWSTSSLRAAQQGLNRMTQAGWVRRGRLSVGESGTQQRLYVLARDGFELAQSRTGRYGPIIAPDAEWADPQVKDARRVLGDLHTNGWMLALQRMAPRAVRTWRGPDEARVRPPRRRERGGWVDLRPQDLAVGGSRKLNGIDAGDLRPVAPNAAVEIQLQTDGTPLRFDLLVQLTRDPGSSSLEAKLRAYDAFITGWASTLDRYKTLKTSPIAVFVAEDERAALTILAAADRALTGSQGKAGEPESEWPFPGRRNLFIAIERDIHIGSLAALQLPEHPPELRERLGGPEARRCKPRRVELIDPRLLGAG